MHNFITIRGAREHNLKNIQLELPKNKLIVITGLSGSGKSTLAFDTIYAEGQRRYVESLSAYARQFLGQMNKPDIDSIDGLSPAISIEQKTTSNNPRSTVGTVTEIYDHLRLLFARIGSAHCPICLKKIQPQSVEQIASIICEYEQGTKLHIFAPIIRDKKGTHQAVYEKYLKLGFARAQTNGQIHDLESPPSLERYKKHTISILVDRLIVRDSQEFISRLTSSLETASQFSDGLLLVQTLGQSKSIEQLFNTKGGCVDHPHIHFESLQPRMFSFNSPFGACPDCHGIGHKKRFDPKLLIDYKKSLADGCVKTYLGPIDSWRKKQLLIVAKHYTIDIFAPFESLSKEQQELLLYGDTQAASGEEYGQQYWQKDAFEGIIPSHDRLYHQTESEGRRNRYEQYMQELPCQTCQGKRLKPESLSVFIEGKNIIDITDMSIRDCLSFFLCLELTAQQQQIAKLLLKEIKERLTFLVDVGLGYLTLSRSAGTLSGGEAQRIRLATQIGSNLTGVLYVLDEPSIGLHQKDNVKLITTLKRLRDLGNTLLVVEHDEDTMRAADFLVDIGPGAGVHGGQIVYAGEPKGIRTCKQSLTGQYLNGVNHIPVPKKRRKSTKKIRIFGANQNNLQNIDVHIPLGVLTVVTGVSGSGKSTLISEILYKALCNHLYKTTKPTGEYEKITGLEHIDKVIEIDQSPIGRTPRSNPATYTNVFTDIRELFSRTKSAKERGYGPGRFSFNVPGGRCESCQGDGLLKIEMNFLPDVYVQCEECKGKRYNAQTLEITYKGKTIADVLDMSVEQALAFFDSIPRIASKLQLLDDVGLGYIKLGQSATTLSGGEAQRIKLTSELAKRATGKTLYLLDEPTTGLHFEDVKKLLDVLNRLVEKKNSVLIIEHNLDVIKSADWIIDLGPDGGDKGGQIVGEGTPEALTKIKKSYTGEFLGPYLKKK
ncbi:MAG: excinuclease ABC subunit UvrA [Candidatus Woesearchaeota archaeon]